MTMVCDMAVASKLRGSTVVVGRRADIRQTTRARMHVKARMHLKAFQKTEV